MNLVRGIAPKDRKQNVILALTTHGGNPDDGFRVMQFLKRHYSKVMFYIFGLCKSAGTMMAVGADSIVMGDFGEFGPLDVQISMESESGRSSVSGLTYHHSMQFLTQQAVQIFQQIFQQFKALGHSQRQASELASRVCVDIISPISSQIEPQRLGEFNRAMQISVNYCQRLQPQKTMIANILTAQYPSHSFVIAREEANRLFGNVRAPNCENEYIMEREFLVFMRHQCAQPLQAPNTLKQDLFIIQHVAPITQEKDIENVSTTTGTGSSNGTSILSEGNTHAESISEPTRNDKESGKRSVGKRITKKKNK